jgi:hypothetical protein
MTSQTTCLMSILMTSLLKNNYASFAEQQDLQLRFQIRTKCQSSTLDYNFKYRFNPSSHGPIFWCPDKTSGDLTSVGQNVRWTKRPVDKTSGGQKKHPAGQNIRRDKTSSRTKRPAT